MEEGTRRFGQVDVVVGAHYFSVTPGSSVTIPFQLMNRTARDEYFEIDVRGIPSTWVLMDMPVIYLAPGELRDASITITPPIGLSASSGATSVTINAVSQADAGVSGGANFELYIGPEEVLAPTVAGATVASAAVPGYISDLGPQQIESGQTVRLLIHNTGSLPDTYSILWQSSDPGVQFTASTPGPVQVMPTNTISVDTAIQSPTTWFGSTRVIPYSVMVQSSRGEVQSHNGEMISRAYLPVWVIPALVVFCLTAVCGIGYLLNTWNPGRQTSATQTAEAQALIDAATTATVMYNQTAAALLGQADDDGDGLTNEQEAQLGSIAQSADSDNDRLLDGDEVRLGTNIMNPDSDGDGILDGLDIEPLDPLNPALTATVAAGVPTLTLTPVPSATLLIPTNTLVPTQVVPTAVPTLTNTVVPTATSVPLPISGSGRIVFESDREGDQELYLYNVADASLVRLTNSGGTDNQPAWSPDGGRIAFTSTRDGNSEIYLMNADGSGVVNLTNSPAEDSFPSWSPDGGSIVFQSNRDGNNEIYAMRADGADVVNLTNSPSNDYAPVWFVERGLLSSQGWILFSTDRDGNSEIYRMGSDGSELANLTNHPSGDAYPAVLPEGDFIAFVSDRDGNGEIYRMDTNGGDVRNLTNHAANDSLPAWSPDGAWIAFVTDREGNNEVYLIGRDGGEVYNFSRSPAQDLYPAWK